MQPHASDANNRRTYPRRKVTFPMSYSGNDGVAQPAFGLNVGGGGVCMLAREIVMRTPGHHTEGVMMIDAHRIPFEGELRWESPIVAHGKTQYRCGIALRVIADEDWNALMTFTLADIGDDGIAHGSLLTAAQRDTMLPVEKQQHIARELVARMRLTDPGEGRLPLIEYVFSGYRRVEGVAYYRLTVRSKTHDRDGETLEYHTPIDAAIETSAIVIGA